ncbi:MAG: tRNA wybutosine-synthesizing 3 family protein [Nanoarchaeota archaeon]
MPFPNEKKTFLAKQDKSKKGSLDEKIIPLITLINSKERYYTTSSCSGRVYFWGGSGKKNETEWLRVSHDVISADFLDVPMQQGALWLRLEGFILHVACKDMNAAEELLEIAQRIYKKSYLLSTTNKIIVEMRGGEIMEMPFMIDGKVVYTGSTEWLVEYINRKFTVIFQGIEKFEKVVQEKLK